MAFYDLGKEERDTLVVQISNDIETDLRTGHQTKLLQYCADADTYIRKTAYLAIGRLYLFDKQLIPYIIRQLDQLLGHEDPKVRQTAINAAGEMGKYDFSLVRHFPLNLRMREKDRNRNQDHGDRTPGHGTGFFPGCNGSPGGRPSSARR